jgi:hypothetical protein
LVSGHAGIAGNERLDQLVGKAASEKQKGRTSISWLKERISQYYTMAKDTKVDKGKHSFKYLKIFSKIDQIFQISYLDCMEVD